MQYRPVWVCLSQRAVSFRRQAAQSAVGTPFVIAIVIACIANMLAVLSIAELNAIMPNLTGGIAHTLFAGLGPLLTIVTMVGGYLISNVFAAPAEGAMFANVMTEMTGEAIPPAVFSVGIAIVLIFINLKRREYVNALQEIVAAFMVVSLLALGIIGGALGLGSGEQVAQDAVISSDFKGHSSAYRNGILVLYRCGVYCTFG